MITYIGDKDWIKKVGASVPKRFKKDVVIVQLDRSSLGTFSSASSIEEAARSANTHNSQIVLVGSCPEQDYISNNSEFWNKLPHDRVHFFDANKGKDLFAQLLASI